MAYSVNIPANSGATLTLEVQKPDFNDYAVVSTSGNECRVTDIEQSLEAPRTVRYASQDVANVYSGLDIDPSAYAPVRRGKSVVIQTSLNVRVTDTTDPDFLVLLPVQVHTVVKMPVTNYLTAENMNLILRDHFGDIVDGATSDRLPRLLRGALKPAELD
jgi:hypothetical protein